MGVTVRVTELLLRVVANTKFHLWMCCVACSKRLHWRRSYVFYYFHPIIFFGHLFSGSLVSRVWVLFLQIQQAGFMSHSHREGWKWQETCKTRTCLRSWKYSNARSCSIRPLLRQAWFGFLLSILVYFCTLNCFSVARLRPSGPEDDPGPSGDDGIRHHRHPSDLPLCEKYRGSAEHHRHWHLQTCRCGSSIEVSNNVTGICRHTVVV